MRVFNAALFVLVLSACKHPLAIVGEGDIVELNGSGRGCTLEQYQLQDAACTNNEASGDYIVNYRGTPKPGWMFVRWEGVCGHLSSAPDCRFDVPAATVIFWDANFADIEIPTLTAVFEELDSDSDGVVDSLDAFPFDPSESQDSDDDGVGDNLDAFPLDETETVDSDQDGVGDNSDDFPLDPTAWDRTTLITEIYVSDVGSNRNGPHVIFRYDEEGNNGIEFITTQLAKPQDIVILEDQAIVLVSNLQTNNINKYDIHTGEYIGEFANGLNGPTRLEVGPDDLIYAIQWNGGFVKRYQQNGDFVDDFTDVGINQAIGIAWDSESNLYVSSFNNGTNGFVRKFNASGVHQGMFINTNLAGPTDIWFDEEGHMLVNDWSDNRVKKFDTLGSFVGDFITGITQPEGVDFLDGNILIGDSRRGSVRMYDSDGVFLQNIVSPGAAGLTTTNAVTVRSVNQ